MKVIQCGMPRSGNYLLFCIIKSVFHYCGFPYSSFIRNHQINPIAKTWDLSFKEQADVDVIKFDSNRCFIQIDEIFRHPIDDIDGFIRQSSHVWTHSKISAYASSVLKKFDKIIYIIRDPRDVAVSMSRFFFTPYVKKYHPHRYPDSDSYLNIELEKLVMEWVMHVKSYLKVREELNIHIIFYEHLVHQKADELGRLLDFLSVKLAPLYQKRLIDETSFEKMKTENPDHLRAGKSGAWRGILSDSQKKRIHHLAGPMMDFLGYSLDEESHEVKLPSIPKMRLPETLLS